LGRVSAVSLTAGDARAAIDAVPRWYHTIEVAPGVTTPGVFDLRPIVDRLPWPEVSGVRCLDVGTFDGFLAFELERRGAREVLATDLGNYEGWDWEHHLVERGPQYMHAVFGESFGAGFEVARRLRGSRATLRFTSVYELSPETVGEFDVVVCGSLLLHLRDPLRALAAIRSVCRGWFLSTNQVDLARSRLLRRSPLVRLDGTSGQTQWWLPNAAAHRQMLRAAGFAIERETGLYALPYGVAHPPRPGGPRAVARRLGQRALLGSAGVPHHAVLARPQ
jgi:tRNA (mo5U34)-methyltransferase